MYPYNILVKFFLILISIWICHFFIFILVVVASVILVEDVNITKEVKLEQHTGSYLINLFPISIIEGKYGSISVGHLSTRASSAYRNGE